MIEEAGATDSRYWDRAISLQLKSMEVKWREKQKTASPNFASANRKSKQQTG
jgi:hypothetical protein